MIANHLIVSDFNPISDTGNQYLKALNIRRLIGKLKRKLDLSFSLKSCINYSGSPVWRESAWNKLMEYLLQHVTQIIFYEYNIIKTGKLSRKNFFIKNQPFEIERNLKGKKSPPGIRNMDLSHFSKLDSGGVYECRTKQAKLFETSTTQKFFDFVKIFENFRSQWLKTSENKENLRYWVYINEKSIEKQTVNSTFQWLIKISTFATL